MTPPPILHWAWWDDLASRYSRRTACLLWVEHKAIATRAEDVTCPRCVEQLKHFDQLAVDDNPF